MLPKRLLACAFVALAAGCTLDWDRFQGRSASADAGKDVAVDTIADDMADADAPAGCSPAADACPTGQYCDPLTTRCVAGCRADADCASETTPDGGAQVLHCDARAHACVSCVTDVHCPVGMLCMANACVAGCGPARGCPSGQTCCSGGCVSTQTSAMHCGACGAACSVPNAVPACAAGACVVDRCMEGRGNCDGSAANGCETDVTTAAAHCGACGRACPPYAHATATCAAGACALGRCDDGFADCDGDPQNGCEVNTRVDTTNCGACRAICMFEGAGAACRTGVCARTMCTPTTRADCDGNPDNGCEVDTLTSAANCGGCARPCVIPHATASCAAGACAIATCDMGFGNCDGNLGNGCETDLTASAANCGTCGNVCAFPGAASLCRAGACAMGPCDVGRGDCDANPANGCEVDVRSNVSHCSRCGGACASRPNAASFCADSRCGLTCTGAFANCDASDLNGCESNTATDVGNCGACGRACSPANAAGACAAGVCSIARCATGWGDCIGGAGDGCETNTDSDAGNCGACGRACAPPNATGSCAAGACRVMRCNGTFDDCDGAAANGCETQLADDSTNCGTCGTRCGTGRTCVFGRCATATFAGYTVTTPPSSVTWTDACAAPGHDTALAGVDDNFASGTVPFPVEFWGGLASEFLVSSNGVVGFGNLYYNLSGEAPATPPARSFGTLPTSSGFYPGAYVFGVDLVQTTGVCIATVGASPNRAWVAESFNARLFSTTLGASAFTFELRAYETDRAIDFLYNAPFTTPFGLTASSPDVVTVGLQDFRSGSSPRAVTYTGPISATTRIRFQPM